MLSNEDLIIQSIVHLLAERDDDASICPSDVARSLAHEEAQWRAVMPEVRRVAAKLVHEEIIKVTQGNVTVNIEGDLRGPIRFRRGLKFPDSSL